MNDRGVIFDMDGVLVDSYRPHFESWRRMAIEHGLDMTEPEFAGQFGRTSREIIRHFWGQRLGGRQFPGEQLSDAQVAAMDRRKEEIYRELIAADFPAMVGARELIESLHAAGFALAVGSSGPAENVAVVLDCLGLGDCFGATVNGSEVTRGKPDPQVFLLAAGKLHVSPGRCAVVEDAPAGLRAARAAGMAAVAITGTAARETLAPLADRVIGSLGELTPAGLAALIDARGAGR